MNCKAGEETRIKAGIKPAYSVPNPSRCHILYTQSTQIKSKYQISTVYIQNITGIYITTTIHLDTYATIHCMWGV